MHATGSTIYTAVVNMLDTRYNMGSIYAAMCIMILITTGICQSRPREYLCHWHDCFCVQTMIICKTLPTAAIMNIANRYYFQQDNTHVLDIRRCSALKITIYLNMLTKWFEFIKFPNNHWTTELTPTIVAQLSTDGKHHVTSLKSSIMNEETDVYISTEFNFIYWTESPKLDYKSVTTISMDISHKFTDYDENFATVSATTIPGRALHDIPIYDINIYVIAVLAILCSVLIAMLTYAIIHIKRGYINVNHAVEMREL